MVGALPARSHVVPWLMLPLLLAGCAAPPETEPGPDVHPLAAAYELSLVPEPSGYMPAIGEWMFVEVTPTPLGGMAAFELKVPVEAMSELRVTAPPYKVVGLQLLPLVLPGHEDALENWALVQGTPLSACHSPMTEPDCAFLGSLFMARQYQAEATDAEPQWVEKDAPDLSALSWYATVHDDGKYRFVVAARGTSDSPFGLLMRLQERKEDSTYVATDAPELHDVNGTVRHVTARRSSTGLLNARLNLVGSGIERTADVTVSYGNRTSAAGLPEHWVSINSASPTTNGTGLVQVRFQVDGFADWRLNGTLRGAPIVERAASSGITQQPTSYAVVKEGEGDSALTADLAARLGTGQTRINYRHIEIGLPMDAWR